MWSPPMERAGGSHLPETVAHLQVTSVTSTLDAWRRGTGERVVAIAGYLRVSGAGPGCDAQPGIPGAACDRRAILAQSGGSGAGTGGVGPGGFGPHIHAVVPPGVIVPGDAGGPLPGIDDFSPVVIIGRFGATDAGCTGDMAGCLDPFVIERVAWATGAGIAFGPLDQAALSVRPRDPVVAGRQDAAIATLGPTTELLRVLLLRPASLMAVDPAAAAAVSSRGITGQVWYVRGLDVHFDPAPSPFSGLRLPRIRWAVVDQASGTIVASGWGDPSAPTGG